ncbi:MAG: hypothetical protein HY320_02005 [Armatimonadetes bacterium]|nr:hypothetical protein [Armatimonadota bacterium]
MCELRYTLLTDGSSDDALVPVLSWLLNRALPHVAVQPEWADLRQLRPPPVPLERRIQAALDYYPCDLLFVHRDAEREDPGGRIKQIRAAVGACRCEVPYVCVVPVRMTEAWLLFDEGALRRAAGNPNGQQALELPSLSSLEDHPNPKGVLKECLKCASGLRGRRLCQFQIPPRRVADLIGDFSPLRGLPAFQRLEAGIQDFGTKFLRATMG